MNETQINRLFEIVYVLLGKGSVTARELSERFGVSVRTIYRDVETLSGVGTLVYMSRWSMQMIADRIVLMSIFNCWPLIFHATAALPE